MKTRLRLGGERGFALVIALATTIVLGLSVTSAIVYTTSNQRSAHLSKGRVTARDLAEAGINNALSILNKANGFDQHALHPQPPPSGISLGNTCSPFADTYDSGTVTYWGWYDSATQLWTITSTGSVRNA